MRSVARIVSVCTVLTLCTAAFGERAIISVDAAKTGPRISPMLYGIFLEEIGHGVDGGLYAEKIRNRAFEDGRAPEGYQLRNGTWTDGTGRRGGFPSGYANTTRGGRGSNFGYVYEGLPFWSLIEAGGAKGTMQLEKTGGISEESAYCLKFQATDVGSGRTGVANEGFFGVGVKAGEKLNLSLYAKAADGFTGPLKVRVEDGNGVAISDEATIDNIGGEWKQFKATLTPTKMNNKSKLAITTNKAGTFYLDFVSLFPADTWKGRENGLRADIAQMIADLKPAFVRFPGGCNVDSGTIETAYDWKLTVGPLEKRSERWGAWDYRRTQGMGLFEMFQFIEDLKADPLWVGFAGETCIHREREFVPMENMGPVRDGFLDIVEYANGAADSKWGGIRAAAGHPQPFNLKHIEIGNENAGQEFRQRYNYIYEAMKAKYPDIVYFADDSFDGANNRLPKDVLDHHHYESAARFLSWYNQYDTRDRNQPPLYLGEVATTSGLQNDPQNMCGSLQAALAEGVFLMGCERNSDTVKMLSYAPLIGHVEGRTALTAAPPAWHAMIYFDGIRAFGTVSYHLWKLFGHNRPDQVITNKLEFENAQPYKITGQIGIGTWASTAEFKDIRVEKNGEVVYASDFASGQAEGWQPQRGGGGGRGRWTVADGAYRQGQQGQSVSYFGDENWSDYTLSLKARKLSGGEGFMIFVGRKGDDRYWWNLGGWGNARHGIEHNQTLVGRDAAGTIENERWYDVKVEVSGSQIKAYLDGKLIHDVTAVPESKFFVETGREDASGDIVVKVINVAREAQPATIKLSGVERILPEAKLAVLTSGNISDNNSLDNPTRIAPVESKVSVSGTELSHEFPANSLSIIRLKTK